MAVDHLTYKDRLGKLGTPAHAYTFFFYQETNISHKSINTISRVLRLSLVSPQILTVFGRPIIAPWRIQTRGTV